MDSGHKKYILEHINTKSIKEIAGELKLKERKIRKFLEKEKEKQKPTKSPSTQEAPPNKQLTALSIILIILFGLCAYGNSMKGQFIYDDETLIMDNVYIRSWSYVSNIFQEDIGAGAGKEFNFYRPVQMFTYRLDHSLWELDARGYHLTNILFHILTALGIYWLVSILFGDQLLSLLTSLFFVGHPIHTQAVSYISGRADLLVSLFMLICFISYVKQSRTKNVYIYLLMLASYVLALLSKENSLILLALVPLYHSISKERFSPKGYVSLLSLSAGYLFLRVTLLKHLIPHTSLQDTSLFERMPGFFVAITHYIQLLFLPLNLHMEYGNKLFSLTDPRAMLGGVILFSLVFFALRFRNQNRLIFFSITWFLVALLPSSNIYPINAFMAEHWLYVSSIGFFLILAKGLCVLFRTTHFKNFSVLLCTGLLIFYAFLTIRQNAVYWRDPTAFYERTLTYAPDSYTVYNNLGKLYLKAGRKEEAIPLFQKSIAVNPDYADAYNNLGAVYYDIDRKEEIIPLLEKSLELNPLQEEALYNMGKVYNESGKSEEAISLFQKAIAINPNYADAYNDLGALYGQSGRREEAIASFKKVIEINPSYAKGYYNLAQLYNDTGKREESISTLKKAVRINPNYAAAHNNLAIVYYYNGEQDSAIQHCDRAVALGYKVQPAFLEMLKPFRK